MINQCSSTPSGDHANSAPNWSAHKSIDCWAAGIQMIYQHDGVNGCWNSKGNGQPGALYVECPPEEEDTCPVAEPPPCGTKLGNPVQKEGLEWVKVVEIEGGNRN